MRSSKVVTVVAALLCVRSACAMPVDEYLRLRRQKAYDPHLTYAQVSARSSDYVGRAFEITGTISGTLQRAQSVSFLLTPAESQAVLLGAPDSETNLVTNAARTKVRVLVRVTDGSIGNVAPLDVLAVAYDSEVTQREQEAAAREPQRRDRERPLPNRPATTSGGGYGVRPMPGSRISGLSDLAARYLSPDAQRCYPAYRNFIAGWNKKLNARDLDGITVSLLYFSDKHKVDPRLVVAMIIAESGFDPKSTSNKGAMGLGQLMPDEARAYGLANPYDPVQNVRASINLLKMKLDYYRDPGTPMQMLTFRQIELAMAAYNAGMGAVHKYGGVPPYRETQRYVQRVIGIYRSLVGGPRAGR